MSDNPAVARLRREAAAEGFVLMRAASRARLIERTRVAEARQAYAERLEEGTRRWAQESTLAEERRLRDRCTFLYGAAIARGATREELTGDASETTESRRLNCPVCGSGEFGDCVCPTLPIDTGDTE